MAKVSVDIRLRPARIALLVRPRDTKSIRRFMRICTCLWGGVFNPIIPVFRRAPAEWNPEPWERTRGYRIAKGYIEFFEPDAFVEAESGLNVLAGLDKRWDERRRNERVLPLDELLSRARHRDRTEPRFGLSMVDRFQQIYDTEQRFKLRDTRAAYLVSGDGSDSIVEAMFGAYPTEQESRHFSRALEAVYKPTHATPSIDLWRKVYLDGAITPLRATGHGIEVEQHWSGNPLIFVFNPDRSTDLIDLWNIRNESYPVLPIPVDWLPNLADDIAKFVAEEHRQVAGAGAGVMHHALVKYSRSISKEEVDELTQVIAAKLPSKKASEKSIGPLVTSTTRNRVWVKNQGKHGPKLARIKLIAGERRMSAPILTGRRQYVEFDALAPSFARRYVESGLRWANAVMLTNRTDADVATVLPFDNYGNRWPQLSLVGGSTLIGSEGWCIGETFKTSTQALRLYSQDEAVRGSLGVLGIEAKLSDAGQVAKQVVEHMGGLRNVRLLADEGTLKLLNRMTRGDGRWTTIEDWKKVLSRREKIDPWPKVTLDDFAERGIVRLGVVTSCPHCMVENWQSLTAVDYQLTCERCRKVYSFPQASLKGKNRNWAYRVVGPFSTRDFARGSYSAVLALNTIRSAVSDMDPVTYSTSLSMNFDGISCEADFVVWHSREVVGGNSRPILVVGEAKSLGKGDLIQDSDLEKMKKIGEKLPGSIIAIAVLKEEFSKTEKNRLRRLVRWGRRLNAERECTNPVLLLTGTELLSRRSLREAWRGKGGAYAEFENQYIEDLPSVAEATVKIYLGLPSFEEERLQAFERRRLESKQGESGA